MPNGFSQIHFDADYLARVDYCITRSIIIFNRIPKKLKTLEIYQHQEKLHNALIDIKQYAGKNITSKQSVAEYFDENTILKHDAKSTRRIRNAVASLQALYGSLPGALQRDNKEGYSKTLELLKQFQTHLEKMAGYMK